MTTRGRKPTEGVEIIDPVLDQPRIDNAHAVMVQGGKDRALAISQHEALVRATALQVGYQLPADCADPDLIQRDISANMRRSVEACLEVGRGLAVLRAACEHGQFINRLDALGIDRKVSAKFMQAAIKFSNVSSTRHLTEAIGNQTKLFEMLVLDDEQIEELELTGQTGDLSLDDIASMSVKELRAALREARAEEKATTELLAEKNRTLDIERAKSKRIQTLPQDEAAAALMAEAAGHFNEAIGYLNGQFRAAMGAVVEHHAVHGGDSHQVLAGYVGQLQQVLNGLREEFMLPDNVGDGTPEWMRATANDVDLAEA